MSGTSRERSVLVSAVPHTLACCALLLACAGGPPRYETSLERPEAPRRPPGVSVERRFATPTSSDEDPRIVVVTPPLEVEEAKRAVDAFLSAVQRKDARALEPLLEPGATQQLTSGRELRSAREFWQRRLARLDYGALPEGPLFRAREIQVRREEDTSPPLAGESAGRGPAGPLTLTVPLLVTHAGGTRLFGPSLTFVFTEVEGRLLIARILEDFQLL